MKILDQKEAALRLEKLSAELRRHNLLYYRRNSPEISDAEYDRLLAELKELEERFPELAAPDSPSQTVGAALLPSFTPVEHYRPMLSLDSSADSAFVDQFLGRLSRNWPQGAGLLLQPKIDGLSVELIFRNQRLRTGSTRGDGAVGEEITANLLTLKDIPSTLSGSPPELVVIRGEVYMDRKGFTELNRSLIEQGEDGFANPRNAAAGGLRQLDPAVTASRPLKFFPFEIVNADEIGLTSDSQALELLQQWGFDAPAQYWEQGMDRQFIERVHSRYLQERESLPFEIDGVVMKVDELALRLEMRTTARHPLWAAAWKFPPRKEVTTINDIAIQVGRTGKLTPVALLQPVDVGGVTVSRASLHNFFEVARLDVRVGDEIQVERAGDVIPHVLKVAAKASPRGASLTPPEACPVCGAEIEANGAYHLCPNNLGCKAQVHASLMHYVSRGAMDIEGLGVKKVADLIERGMLTDLLSIYGLYKRRRELEELDGWGEVSVNNLMDSIEKTKGKPFNRFIFGLGIPSVGQATARELAKSFPSLMDLAQAPRESLLAAGGATPKIAHQIESFFGREQTRIMALALADVVKPTPPRADQDRGAPLSGKSFVFTGGLQQITRPQAESMVRRLGGRPVKTVSQKTSYVVAGENPGSKFRRAQTLGVPIISETEFTALVNEAKPPSGDAQAGVETNQMNLGFQEKP